MGLGRVQAPREILVVAQGDVPGPEGLLVLQHVPGQLGGRVDADAELADDPGLIVDGRHLVEARQQVRVFAFEGDDAALGQLHAQRRSGDADVADRAVDHEQPVDAGLLGGAVDLAAGQVHRDGGRGLEIGDEGTAGDAQRQVGARRRRDPDPVGAGEAGDQRARDVVHRGVVGVHRADHHGLVDAGAVTQADPAGVLDGLDPLHAEGDLAADAAEGVDDDRARAEAAGHVVRHGLQGALGFRQGEQSGLASVGGGGPHEGITDAAGCLVGDDEHVVGGDQVQNVNERLLGAAIHWGEVDHRVVVSFGWRGLPRSKG